MPDWPRSSVNLQAQTKRNTTAAPRGEKETRMNQDKRNSIATVEYIEKTGLVRNEDYRAECYGVFTQKIDMWFSGFVSVCHDLAWKQFHAYKEANIPCELVDALKDEAIASFKM